MGGKINIVYGVGGGVGEGRENGGGEMGGGWGPQNRQVTETKPGSGAATKRSIT